MSSSKNLNNHQESFLSQTNSSFIENMYVRFIKKDPKLPESWSKYFEGLNDDVELVLKEIKQLNQSFITSVEKRILHAD